jgi:hypothetical protein
MNIITEHVHPPIPARNYDWISYDEDTYEPGSPCGWGRTREEAIADLQTQMEDA